MWVVSLCQGHFRAHPDRPHRILRSISPPTDFECREVPPVGGDEAEPSCGPDRMSSHTVRVHVLTVVTLGEEQVWL
jgi:hypothetical protein